MDGASRSERSLERIIAILVALAVLAERAAARSFPVRWLFLCLLRRAVPVVRRFVAEATQCEWLCFEESEEVGNGPADAILLAASFRAMAATLAALLPPARPFPGRSGLVDGGPCRFPLRPGLLAAAAGVRAERPNDTS